MPGSSDLEPIFGGLSSELPAEVRLVEHQESVRQTDLVAFQLEVEKRIRVINLIAEEYLPDEAEAEAIISGQFSSRESESERQQGIQKTEQLLRKKLTEEVVGLFIPISFSVTDTKQERATIIEEAKAKLAKEIAEETYVAHREAKKILSWGATRRRLCPALDGFANDAFEVSKALVPVLVPLSIVGTLAIPAQPMLYGWMALIGFRVSIKSLCKGYIEPAKGDDS